MKTLFGLCLLAMILVACSDMRGLASGATLTNEAMASCPVTYPNESSVPKEYTYWGNYWHDSLVVSLGPGGKIVPSPDQFNTDGSLDWKIGLYRLVEGELDVTGQRLDAPAPPALGHYEKEGYGNSGFQSGGVHFPGEGCWEITARLAGTRLTFVTLVVRVPFDPFWPAWLPVELVMEDLQARRDPWSIQSVYRSPQGEEGEIVVETIQGLWEPRDSQEEPIPEEAARRVEVGGAAGVCVRGARDESGRWQAGEDSGFLDWASGELRYRIRHSGLGLTCEDLLRIAGTVSTP